MAKAPVVGTHGPTANDLARQWQRIRTHLSEQAISTGLGRVLCHPVGRLVAAGMVGLFIGWVLGRRTAGRFWAARVQSAKAAAPEPSPAPGVVSALLRLALVVATAAVRSRLR